MQTLSGRGEPIGLPRRVVFGDAGARLQGGGGYLVVDDIEFDHMCRRCEGRLHRRLVALVPAIDDVAGRRVPQKRSPGFLSPHPVRHGGSHLVAHFDQLRRRARHGLGLCYDKGHMVADIAHPVARQCRPRGNIEARLLGQFGDARQIVDPVRIQVRHRMYAQHTRQRRRRRDVDPGDIRVGVRRTHDGAVDLAFHIQVVRVLRGAGEKASVFEAGGRLPHLGTGHVIAFRWRMSCGAGQSNGLKCLLSARPWRW